MTTGVPFNTFLNGPDYRPCERVYNTLIDYMDNRWMFRWHNPFGDSDPDKNLHNFVVKLGENYKGGKVPKDVAAKIIEFLKAWQRGPIPTPAMQGKLARLIMLAKSADPDDYGYDQKFEILDLIFRDEQVAKWYPNLADEYLMIKLQKQA